MSLEFREILAEKHENFTRSEREGKKNKKQVFGEILLIVRFHWLSGNFTDCQWDFTDFTVVRGSQENEWNFTVPDHVSMGYMKQGYVTLDPSGVSYVQLKFCDIPSPVHENETHPEKKCRI